MLHLNTNDERFYRASRTDISGEFNELEINEVRSTNTKATINNKIRRRLRTRKMIEERLLKQQKKMIESPANETKIKLIAACIEKKLYSHGFLSSDTDTCSDTVINEHLQLLMGELLNKKNHSQNCVSGIEGRMKALERIVGTETYTEICNVVNKINNLKMNHTCTACIGGSCRQKLSLRANEKVPVPVQGLFFHTDLINAVERATTEDFYNLQWDRMLQNADKNVKAYEEWARVSKQASSTFFTSDEGK